MTDTLRLAGILASSALSPRVDLFDRVTLRMTALPSDCDSNRHVNNARYLALMDLGRFALIARLGLLPVIVRERWAPIVGAVELDFRRELPMFSRFSLTTRIAGWDAKWIYIEQRFERDGDLAATGRVQGLFKRGGARVQTGELLAHIGPDHVSPGLPASFDALSRGRKRMLGGLDDLPGFA